MIACHSTYLRIISSDCRYDSDYGNFENALYSKKIAANANGITPRVRVFRRQPEIVCTWMLATPLSFTPVLWFVQGVRAQNRASDLSNGALAKLQDHPCVGVLLGDWVRRREPEPPCWLESEAWVIRWVAKNEDELAS